MALSDDAPERTSRPSVYAGSGDATHSIPVRDELDRFIEAVRAVGLLGDADAAEIARCRSEVRDSKELTARHQFLRAYYGAAGDGARSAARMHADRYFGYLEDDAMTAKKLLARLVSLCPEVGDAQIDRVGSAEDGQLVVRSGEVAIAIYDDAQLSEDTDELDIRELERPNEMVTVRGIVRAINALLARGEVRKRLIALKAAEGWETYVGLGVHDAVDLLIGGWLEDEATEDVMELGAW